MPATDPPDHRAGTRAAFPEHDRAEHDQAERDRVDPVLDRLKRLHPKVIDLSLGRIWRLLAALEHPERRLPPVVHVAGTNGKGSTVAFLRAFLEAAGARVHVYTSPHLVRFHERIRLGASKGGRLIADDALLALLERCEAVNAEAPITFFEITTAAAFLAFAESPADIVLLETGLGGRLDATNVIDHPAVTALTRISYDHMSFLGDTLSAIAGEKAGILKPGVPVVIAPQPAPEVAETLSRHAAALGAPILPWRIAPQLPPPTPHQGTFHQGTFHFTSPGRTAAFPAPALPGAHQIINAGTALACLDPLARHLPASVSVTNAALVRGLASVSWPARLQRLTQGPLVRALPPGWELWLDGGHNDSAGEILANHAAFWANAAPPLPLMLIFGMLATKQPTAFLAPLAPWVTRVATVPIPGESAALSPEDAAAFAHAAGMGFVNAYPTPEEALTSLIAEASGACRVLIGGSLYLAGRILGAHG